VVIVFSLLLRASLGFRLVLVLVYSRSSPLRVKSAKVFIRDGLGLDFNCKSLPSEGFAGKVLILNGKAPVFGRGFPNSLLSIAFWG
jgi:hypothetical protein